MLVKNNTSPVSDRTLTIVTNTPNTLHFGGDADSDGSGNIGLPVTVSGGHISIISGMVFGNSDIVLSSVGLDSSITY